MSLVRNKIINKLVLGYREKRLYISLNLHGNITELYFETGSYLNSGDIVNFHLRFRVFCCYVIVKCLILFQFISQFFGLKRKEE